MQTSSMQSLRATLLRGLLVLATPAVASYHCSTPSQACSILASALPAEAFVAPNSTGYETVQSSYWSETAGDLSPACITRPRNTDQVASIVKILSSCGSDVRFAVKSGGHGSWPGWSSTDGGVLISLDLIDGVQNVADSGYAVVGSGARWVDVYKTLEPQGVTVIGGRFASIGVGGLVVGGGISYFTGLHGMACDNVLNYEVVLADGTIANVNQTSKPDLFRALKGGGNQFGIVTRFSLKTYKQTTQVWAGILTFSIDKASQVFNATQAFIARYDPLSHMYLSMGGGSNPQLSFINVYVFYNASSPPTGDANPFAAFYAAEPIADTTSTQNYSTLIASNNNGNTPQKRWLIGGHTFPNLLAPYGADLYLKQWQAFRDMANATAAGDQNLLFSMALVPVPAVAMRAGENVTGVKNVLGLEPDAGDAVWIDYTLAWLDAKDDRKMFGFVERISNAGDRLATSFAPGVANTNAIPGAVTAKEAEFYRTNPRYMNYALLDQPVQSSYGEKNERFLKRVQKRYDPNGLWRKNGGFLWD
ncbi:6-hydroxy-d-nicotine oxidase [Fusarium pseudoanthophilum]|uniref:6-hydroxy-d-nicotine oxidase n=1 Tax=Fusarium pseudoanthophilum TaxID=48495 RepID=A0A8H5KDY9_9HYPO|nr:6-hydroxy-d-nicotine oxidase [Fusarium pseudoanthophilum]